MTVGIVAPFRRRHRPVRTGRSILLLGRAPHLSSAPAPGSLAGPACGNVTRRLASGRRLVRRLKRRAGPGFGNVTRRMGWLGPRATLLPGDPGRRAGANRSSRWRGSKAVTAHDLAKLFDVRRAVAAEHVGDIFEVARAHQTRADDRKEAGVS